ncbi:MAG: ABC transporter ATP-binding protein [Desertimonas sp.]
MTAADGPADDGDRLRQYAARELRAGYDGAALVDGLDLDIEPGTITALIGPNACGKSTLLRALSRTLGLMGGQVVLDGTDIHRQSTRAVARKLGLLPQSPTAPEGITVIDLVRRGRLPHARLGSLSGRGDVIAVADALSLTNTAELIRRPIDSLSGGQRQRVWIAMTLATQTPTLLLDEPTTFLDIAHQMEVLNLLVDLNRHRGKTIVLVLHDITQAALVADQVLAMREGAIVARGTPEEVVTADVIGDVFGLAVNVFHDPDSGRPVVLPRSRRHRRVESCEEPRPRWLR